MKVRLGILLFGLPGFLGVLAPLSIPDARATLIYLGSGVSMMIALVLWRYRRCVPEATYLPLLLVGLALDGIGLVAAHSTATMALVFLPAVMWGSHYLTSRRQLASSLAFMALVYGGALVADRPSGVQPLGQWLFTMAYLVIASAVTRAITERLDTVLSAAREAALVDALTGLGNRRQLMKDLAEVAVAGSHVVVLLDLNNFKAYNDRHGHLAGDALLRSLGERFATAVSGAGRAYRLGGDEFCAILSGRDEESQVVNRLCLAFEDRGQAHRIDAAWGCVIVPDEGRTATEVLGLADERMYACKRRQRSPAQAPARQELVQA